MECAASRIANKYVLYNVDFVAGCYKQMNVWETLGCKPSSRNVL